MNIKKKYCGHIAIIGKPNSGKSTLINAIIQDNISIVSRKKNTTQENIIGILTENNYQYIYLDTPGVIFFKRHDYISENIKHILKQIKHSILIIFVLDKTFWTEQDETIYKNIKKHNIPIIVLINKIDKISNKNTILPYINFLKKKIIFIDVIPISAKFGNNVAVINKIIKPFLPECNHIYPKIYNTANSHFFTMSEIIRKECLLFLGDELPSIIKVSIESFQKMNIGDWKIRAIIHVDNLGQKKIVIGHKGKNIKKISMLSRYNIRKKFNKKIHLFLWIKINI